MIEFVEVLGFTLESIGKILVAYTAIAVHHRFRKEHKVDEQVFKTMRKEQYLGIAGIVLLVIGYFLQLPFKF